MGTVSRYVSRAYDKLPSWVKLVLGICAIAGIVYYTVREGPVFLLKVIFTAFPETMESF